MNAYSVPQTVWSHNTDKGCIPACAGPLRHTHRRLGFMEILLATPYMVRLLEGAMQIYEWLLSYIYPLPTVNMWLGNIILDYYETNMTLDKSVFCFVLSILEAVQKI